MRADGHPLAGPGAVGENLTLEGVDLGALGPGSRLAIGDGGLVIEVASYAAPCQTIADSFTERRIARISPKTNLADARRYCRVLTRGPGGRGRSREGRPRGGGDPAPATAPDARGAGGA